MSYASRLELWSIWLGTDNIFQSLFYEIELILDSIIVVHPGYQQETEIEKPIIGL